ncbi:anti-sigma F factor [Clostridiales bacterium]|nr:anti-sigma F factor [Clostridiales bacterium]
MINDKNSMTLTFPSAAQNEAFARMSVAAFIIPLDPTVSEITDIKTAVSEAVTNSIIHGYEGCSGSICLMCSYEGRDLYIEITDYGKGIADIKKAMTPLYTSRPELERSGLGFTVMETFMDRIDVTSELGKGTTIRMYKKLSDNK